MTIHRKCKATLFLALLLPGCGGKWSAPHPVPGPTPLAPPGATITRLQRELPTFEVTYTETLWDDGTGPIKIEDRAKTITDAVPQDLLNRLRSTRQALDVFGKPYAQKIYDARLVIVALNPDVLILSVADRPPPTHQGELNEVFNYWDRIDGRWQIVHNRLERLGGFWEEDFTIYAGPLVPFSEEMYVISTDPKVPCQRLKFDDNRATIPLPTGKLLLSRHDIDVEVTRE